MYTEYQSRRLQINFAHQKSILHTENQSRISNIKLTHQISILHTEYQSINPAHHKSIKQNENLVYLDFNEFSCCVRLRLFVVNLHVLKFPFTVPGIWPKHALSWILPVKDDIKSLVTCLHKPQAIITT